MSLNYEQLFDDGDGIVPSITYNGEIDADIVAVLMESATDNFYMSDISKKLNLPEKYVELIQHVLSDMDMVDYGTSPRGAWISEKGLAYLEYLKRVGVA